MGTCTSKPPKPNPYSSRDDPNDQSAPSQTPTALPSLTPHHNSKHDAVSGHRNSHSQSPFFPFYSPSPAHYLKKSPATKPKSATSTPSRFFRRPFPPPSPAKHIKAVLARRLGKKATATVAIPEDGEDEDGVDLDKRFACMIGEEEEEEDG